jgi:hypothetical protein
MGLPCERRTPRLRVLNVVRCFLDLLEGGGERRMVLPLPLRNPLDSRLAQTPVGAQAPVAEQYSVVPGSGCR